MRSGQVLHPRSLRRNFNNSIEVGQLKRVDMASISVQGIRVEYDSRPVLDDFSLKVYTGEFIVIIGPNGSGKTTLLRTVARALQPARGAIVVDGHDIAQLRASELSQRVGTVPQHTPASFDFTCFDITLMGRTPYLSPLAHLSAEDLSIVKEVMNETGVWELRDRYFTQISGGERQRVIIARALAQEPQILLLDEPTANLDLRYQLEIMDLLGRLNTERGITIVCVMHDLNLALMAADKFVLLDNNSQIHAMGTAADVLTSVSIESVYGVSVEVSKHPATGKHHVTLLPRKRQPSSGDNTP